MPSRTAVAHKDIVIIGGGIVGASTAYYLSRHPSFSPSHHTITILESTSIASAASGKAGGLLALDWHSEPTSPLAHLSFLLHADLAKQHDGESKWGYRRLEAVHLEADMSSPPGGGADKKDPRGLRGWLGEDLGKRMRTRSLGGKETIAQVHPKLFTEELVRLSGAKVVLASATSLVYGKGVAGEEKRVVGVGITTSTTDVDEVEQEIKATEVVIAAGPWTGVLSKRLLGEKIGGVLDVRGSRAHSIVLKTRGMEITPHAIFTNLTLEDGEQTEPEMYPRPDGTIYICGATDDEPLPSHSSSVQASDEHLNTLHREITTLSPHLANAEEVVRQACYLPVSERGKPFVGKVKGVEGVWIGGGLTCWGITLGPGTGKCIADGIFSARGIISVANVSKIAP